MQIKSIAMLAIAGCVIGLSTGCVKQEEYDAMVQKLTNEKDQAVSELNTKLADSDSLLTAEQAKTRKLQIELNDSAERIDELKSKVQELSDGLEAAKGNVSKLESSLASAKASISSAQQKAADAENAKNVMEIEKQETQRRFDMLRKALLDLNKIKPADIGVQLEGLVGDMGSMDSGSDMSDLGDAAQPAATTGSDADSLKGMLDDMENM